MFNGRKNTEVSKDWPYLQKLLLACKTSAYMYKFDYLSLLDHQFFACDRIVVGDMSYQEHSLNYPNRLDSIAINIGATET